MRIIKTYEKFSESKFLKKREKAEKKINQERERAEKMINQKIGDKYIVDIIKEGDLEGLNYLLDKGFSLKNSNADENLLEIAIMNRQMEMVDFLLNKSDYFEDSGWSEEDGPINSFPIGPLIDEKDGEKFISPESIETLKIITKLGYNFNSNDYNDIQLYLSEPIYKKRDYEYKLIKGADKFVDWLLEDYPKYYPLVKEITLPEKLKMKYSYLDSSINYNL